MKPKTDPKTGVSRAILSQQDINHVCKAIDVFKGVCLIEECDRSFELASGTQDWLGKRLDDEKARAMIAAPVQQAANQADKMESEDDA